MVLSYYFTSSSLYRRMSTEFHATLRRWRRQPGGISLVYVMAATAVLGILAYNRGGFVKFIPAPSSHSGDGSTPDNVGPRAAEVAWSRPPARFVQHLLTGFPAKPPRVPFKRFMYDCFLEDVAALAGSSVAAVSAAPRGLALRLATFNVHFFRRGFSDVALEDSRAVVLADLTALDPDVAFLQEVPASEVEGLREDLRKRGWFHFVAAGAADVHVLPDSVGPVVSFPGERLHACIASKLPFLASGAAPLGDGGAAAFAEMSLSSGGGGGGGGSEGGGSSGSDSGSDSGSGGSSGGGGSGGDADAATALVYSAHLSVRCAGSVRRAEVAAIAAHARAHAAAARARAASGEAGPAVCGLMVVAGDLNQPSVADYPPDEWAALASDLDRAKIDRSDGVRETLRSHLGLVPSFAVAASAATVAASIRGSSGSRSGGSGAGGGLAAHAPGLAGALPATTAWNGAMVDFIYLSGAPGEGRHSGSSAEADDAFVRSGAEDRAEDRAEGRAEDSGGSGGGDDGGDGGGGAFWPSPCPPLESLGFDAAGVTTKVFATASSDHLPVVVDIPFVS